MTSDRTKHCKKMRNLFFGLSTALLVGTVIFVIVMISNILNVPKESADILSQTLKDKIIAFGTTSIIVFIIAIFIKDKARTAIYMLSCIISVIIKGEPGVYIILSIWALDEYVFHALYKSFKNKVTINKEIDRR